MFRNTSQFLMPLKKSTITQKGEYDIYPSFDVGKGKIKTGFNTFAKELLKFKNIRIDGYAGVFYDNLKDKLSNAFQEAGIDVNWHLMQDVFKSEDEINNMAGPFLGGDDPVFGTRTTLDLTDFFDKEKIDMLSSADEEEVNIFIGAGAAFVEKDGPLIYVDLPKNEIQFRARAGAVTNLGMSQPSGSKQMYKRFYFVDWVVLNKHKKDIINDIDWFVDEQRSDEITYIAGQDLRDALSEMSKTAFRVRPWFEPGVWGGTWIKDRIKGLNKEVENYAWSFVPLLPL